MRTAWAFFAIFQTVVASWPILVTLDFPIAADLAASTFGYTDHGEISAGV